MLAACDQGIEENLISVRNRMAQVLERDRRHRHTAQLVAVSKTAGPDRIQAAYRCGQRDFGESRVQEWLAKKDHLPADCRWHFIGRLQTNKVKYLDESIVLIHSLDRAALLEALDTEGRRRNHIWQALIQVNIDEDAAKAGLAPQDLPVFLDQAAKCPCVVLRGLMTIGRVNASREAACETFSALRRLRDSLRGTGLVAKELFTELSMGMSGDFAWALEEGATLVRVGSGIFGQRQ
jgi:pyridoxal phosphate enzyme (YggS family)